MHCLKRRERREYRVHAHIIYIRSVWQYAHIINIILSLHKVQFILFTNSLVLGVNEEMVIMRYDNNEFRLDEREY